METQGHWESVYRRKQAEDVSWYQPRADLSLALITASGVGRDEPVIDVGGGASVLVDNLLARGYADITVLDIAEAGLTHARQRLGGAGETVTWLVGDITQIHLPANTYGLWHDRAVFHFLVTADARQRYKKTMTRSLKPGGYVVMATFAEDGPEQCSGLPVRRYSVGEMQAELGSGFSLRRHEKATHVTPAGAEQRFLYCLFQLGKQA